VQGGGEGAPPSAPGLGGHESEGEGGAEAGPSGPPGRLQSITPGVGGAAALPRQKSHNSNGGDGTGEPKPLEFPASAKRTAYALQVNVAAMCERHGIEKIGFLTLTFAEHILDPKEAQRRLNSLTTGVLRPRYGQVIRVLERQKSGRIHYHLLVNVGVDIRTGVDFDAIAEGDYRSAGVELRAEWAFWRRTAKRYGFGRTELLPVRSTSEAIGRYVGKYIAKHLDQREARDRRVRLVSYSGCRVASTRFGWAEGGGREWRQKVKAFVTMLYDAGAILSPTAAAMRIKFGPRWAHYWRDSIARYCEQA
jgi:hypothetical protein